MTLDKLKGAALIGTFIGVLTIFAMWVALWENVWSASVEPLRSQAYIARIGSSPCMFKSWSWWWTAKCKLT